MSPARRTSLLVTDIDNTVFDWVRYYTAAFTALLQRVEELTAVPVDVLASEAKVVFAAHGSIEYPFVVQELPSVLQRFGADVERLLREVVSPARDVFKREGAAHLVPYPGVVEAFCRLKAEFPRLPIVALTDAPRYVAMWKLNKLGLLPYFDAVYGLGDPRIPVDEQRGIVKVDARLLIKHLQQFNFGFQGKIRALPDEYEKPGVRGFKTILMDYEMDEPDHRENVLWVGDNLHKDVGLGKRLGVRTAWAAYGTAIDPRHLELLGRFSPNREVANKNSALAEKTMSCVDADMVLAKFADLIGYLEG